MIHEYMFILVTMAVGLTLFCVGFQPDFATDFAVRYMDAIQIPIPALIRRPAGGPADAG